MTGATMFTGFGGADLGMKAAGIEMLWGIEYDDNPLIAGQQDEAGALRMAAWRASGVLIQVKRAGSPDETYHDLPSATS